MHVDRVAALGVEGDVVPSLLVDRDGVLKVLVELVDVLEHVPFVRARDADVVDEGQVDDLQTRKTVRP